jgi:hypothetical protein
VEQDDNANRGDLAPHGGEWRANMPAVTVTTGAEARSSRADRPHAHPWRQWVWIATIVVLSLTGLGLRLWFMTGSRGYLDADESITALTAQWLLRGDVRTFFFGQEYGGTLMALPVALSETVFGVNRVGVYLPFLVLGAVASVLVWRVGTRFLSSAGAVFAGLASWVWPAIFVFYGTRAQMFYVSGLVLGLAMVLCTQRAVEGRSRYTDWALAGLFAGLGWWQSPNILYFLVPTLVWLVAARLLLPALPRALVALPTACVGALPWIAYAIAHRFPSFPDTSGVHGSYVDHLRFFGRYPLPTALGLRAPYRADWVPDLGHQLVYGAVLVALVAAVVVGIRCNRAWGSIALLTFPFLFALVPFGSNLAFGKYYSGFRYVFSLVAILPLAIGVLVRRRAAAVAVLSLMLVSTAYGTYRITEYGDDGGGFGGAPRLEALQHRLEEQEITAVRAPFWVAWRLTFESGEKIVAIPSDFGSQYGPYRREVETADESVWVFYADGSADTFVRDQRAEGAVVRQERVGAYDVVVVEAPGSSPSERPTGS